MTRLLRVAGLLGVWALFLTVSSVAPLAFAQRAQSSLEIGGMSHTAVDGRSVIVVVVGNSGDQAVEPTGEFVLVAPSGVELVHVNVTSTPIPPGGESVIAVPIATELESGLYTATLSLEDENTGARVNSGLREITVGVADETPTIIELFPDEIEPVQVEEQTESDARGFPSWLLLLIGLSVTVLGVTFMRSTASSGRKQERPVPTVSMVRKVKVDTSPPRRPATIKPLIPPRRTKRD